VGQTKNPNFGHEVNLMSAREAGKNQCMEGTGLVIKAGHLIFGLNESQMTWKWSRSPIYNPMSLAELPRERE